MAKRKKTPRAVAAIRRPAPGLWDDWQGASALQYADAGEVLERLGRVVAERDRLGVAVEELVARGREKGLTWTQLGRALGVSPQAVQKRYGRG